MGMKPSTNHWSLRRAANTARTPAAIVRKTASGNRANAF